MFDASLKKIENLIRTSFIQREWIVLMALSRQSRQDGSFLFFIFLLLLHMLLTAPDGHMLVPHHVILNVHIAVNCTADSAGIVVRLDGIN